MGGERWFGTDEDRERDKPEPAKPAQSSMLAGANSARLALLGQVTYPDANGVCRAQTPVESLAPNQSRLPLPKTAEERWREVIGEESTQFEHVAHVCVPKGVRVRVAPHADADDVGIIPFDTRVKIERKTKHGWCYVTVLPQQVGGGSSELAGAAGFVEGRFLLLDPPDTGSFLHMVKPGEGAANVAARYFKPPEGFTTGYDAWLFVSALYEVNKQGLRTAEGTYPSAIERRDVSLGLRKTLPRWADEEESMRIYLGARLRAGHAMWIPSFDKVFEMKWAGKITSAAVLSKAGYAGGFLRGLMDGIADAVKDLYRDAKAIAQLLYALFVEDKLYEKLLELAKKIGRAIAHFDANKAAAAGKKILSDFVDKWTHPDEFYSGHFQGQTVGYLLVLVLPMLLSAGATALARAPRAAQVLRVLGAVMDPGELVADFAKGMRGAGLTEQALSSRLAREGIDATPIREATDVATSKEAKAVSKAATPEQLPKATESTGTSTTVEAEAQSVPTRAPEEEWPVVAGRRIKPRQATATKYRWANPRMSKGNFIEAEFDDGILKVTVKSHGPDDIRIGGRRLLDDVFTHFGDKNIKQFDALWVRESSFTDNYDKFMSNLSKGMSPEDAAWNTWTGEQLRDLGFKSVRVPPFEGGIVRPEFKR